MLLLSKVTAAHCNSAARVSKKALDVTMAFALVSTSQPIQAHISEILLVINLNRTNERRRVPRHFVPEFYGPFHSEREFIGAFTFMDKPPTQGGRRLDFGVLEDILEVDDVALYQSYEASRTTCQKLHFVHGTWMTITS